MGLGYDLRFIRRRYNGVASFYPLFEILLLLPPGIRAKAVACLGLKSGDSVLEVGCGTGRNLPHLLRAVGPAGHIYGVDYSEGMLAKAKQLCWRNQWKNVTLLCEDAAQVLLPSLVDGVLFSLSYAVAPEPRKVLAQAWKYLRPGGHIVIMDAKLAKGPFGALIRPFVILLMKATVLGDPDIRPWEDLRQWTPEIKMQEMNLGTYYICRGTKS
jgi:ubiquinone/menaquinone biosynthesis C-methylase UbiE